MGGSSDVRLLGELPHVRYDHSHGSAPVPKATRRDNNFVNVFQVVSIAGIYYCGITMTFPEYLLSIGVFLLVTGLIAGFLTRHSAVSSA